MTDHKNHQPLMPGDQFHFLKTGMTIPRHNVSEISRRGQTVTVTAQLLEDGRDREGDCWLDLIDDVAAQTRRWGEPAFARGPAPSDMYLFRKGSPEEDIARDQARAEAFAIVNPEQRAKALAKVSKVYGRKVTSQTLQVVRGDDERAAEEGRGR